MKTISKIFLSIIIIFILIIIEELTLGLGIKSWLNSQRTNIDYIDTSFFNNEQKGELIDVGNLLLDNSIYGVEFINNELQYYDENHNIVVTATILGLNVKNIFQKYNIKDLTLIEINNGIITRLSIKFINKKFIYNYIFMEHNYNEGDTILSSYRVEKVIDRHWYILRLCENRNMCSESQG